MPELLPHSLKWEQRKIGKLTGVKEVISFDEKEIQVETTMGILTVTGESLQVKQLSVEKGEMEIKGMVHKLAYSESRGEKGKSLMQRMFG